MLGACTPGGGTRCCSTLRDRERERRDLLIQPWHGYQRMGGPTSLALLEAAAHPFCDALAGGTPRHPRHACPPTTIRRGLLTQAQICHAASDRNVLVLRLRVCAGRRPRVASILPRCHPELRARRLRNRLPSQRHSQRQSASSRCHAREERSRRGAPFQR